jgi:hypothetical protein
MVGDPSRRSALRFIWARIVPFAFLGAHSCAERNSPRPVSVDTRMVPVCVTDIAAEFGDTRSEAPRFDRSAHPTAPNEAPNAAADQFGTARPDPDEVAAGLRRCV